MELLAPLFTTPLKGLSFFLLILAFIFIWIKRRWGVWFILFISSFASAYYTGIIEPQTTVPIGLLLFSQLLLHKDVKGFARLFLVMIPTMISFALLTHSLKGFQNIPLLSEWKLSPDALPINFSMNYDTPLIGLFVLGFTLPLIRSKKEILRSLAFTLPLAFVIIPALFFIATSLKLLVFAPKFSPLLSLFFLSQIFFTTLPEEAFFRGFLQREITKDLPNKFGGVLAIIVTSLLFTSTHLFYLPDPSYLLFTFLTSLCYGAIFHITGYIESSIFLHLLINLTHLFFFTYPLLAHP